MIDSERDHHCSHSQAKPQAKLPWGQRIDAQRFHRINIRSRELELYELQINYCIGCARLKVSELRLMIPMAEEVLKTRLERSEKKVKWALLARLKQAFPSANEFVDAARRAMLPFVQHLSRPLEGIDCGGATDQATYQAENVQLPVPEIPDSDDESKYFNLDPCRKSDDVGWDDCFYG